MRATAVETATLWASARSADTGGAWCGVETGAGDLDGSGPEAVALIRRRSRHRISGSANQ